MILDISDKMFRSIIGDPVIALPKERKENCFKKDLILLFTHYEDLLKNVLPSVPGRHVLNGISNQFDAITDICNRICNIVDAYLCGLPSKAYNRFVRLMQKYYINTQNTLNVYQKTNTYGLSGSPDEDSLSFFRVRGRIDTMDRVELFHIPKEKRELIAATRYSISGYPSLYLSTNLGLACNETGIKKEGYASLFKLNRNITDIMIRVIDLAIKPQDFLEESITRYYGDETVPNPGGARVFSSRNTMFNDKAFQRAYLYWYPLIASCSFIRKANDSKFNAEYIVPQLLMQWVRKITNTSLCGIRYFSCRDEKSSDMGFNYVFPVIDFKFKATSNKNHYCSVLQEAFSLSTPRKIDNNPNRTQQELLVDASRVERINGIVDPD